MKYIVNTGNNQHTVRIHEGPQGLEIEVDDQPATLSVVSDARHSKLLLLLNSRSYDTEISRSNGITSVLHLGRQFDCKVEDERLVAIREVAGVKQVEEGVRLRAPMPGLVVKVLKETGETVKKGEPVVIVEAMKMENELKAPADGVVEEIMVKAGQAVDKGDVLIAFA